MATSGMTSMVALCLRLAWAILNPRGSQSSCRYWICVRGWKGAWIRSTSLINHQVRSQDSGLSQYILTIGTYKRMNFEGGANLTMVRS